MGTKSPSNGGSTDNILRRRMNILERAASKAADHGGPSSPHAASRSSLDDFEDESDESSHEDVPPESPTSTRSHAVPRLNTVYHSGTTSGSNSDLDTPPFEAQPPQSSWYQFDLAVLAALVSPLGRMLTGGDHVKNLFFVLLLIFYLHQVIEVPWKLYVGSLPRRPVPLDDPSAARLNPHLTNELRRLEFFFLFVTLVSPIAGGALLHYLTPFITGDEPTSFFSTGLFILATAIRPWTHLVKRLANRTTELHNAIHYPPVHAPSKSSEKMADFQSSTAAELDELKDRMNRFEKAIGKLRHRTGDELEELYDFVEDMERSLNRSEKGLEKVEGRVAFVEDTVRRLPPPGQSQPLSLENTVPQAVLSILSYVYPKRPITAQAEAGASAPNGSSHSTAPGSKRRARIHSGSPNNSGLATIPEESDEMPMHSIDGLPSKSTSPPPNPFVRHHRKVAMRRKPITTSIFDLFTFPLRSIWRLITTAYY